MMSARLTSALMLLLTVLAVDGFAQEYEGATPSAENGARVYAQRCTLCHGPQGMGEGNLPLRLKDYPNTNLMKNITSQSYGELRNAIVYGGSTGLMSNFMPPMGADLSWIEIESVTQFTQLLRSDFAQADHMLRTLKAVAVPSIREGAKIFQNRCQLCHGEFGDGKGRMARIIKTPPPANLIFSRLDDSQLLQIIMGGGEVVNRSPQMPPWGDQLSQSEIQSVIDYIKSLRRSPPNSSTYSSTYSSTKSL